MKRRVFVRILLPSQQRFIHYRSMYVPQYLLRFLFITAFSFALSGCLGSPVAGDKFLLNKGKMIENQQVKQVLELFTRTRIEQHLFAPEIPSNKELLIFASQQSGIQPEDFFTTLNKNYPGIKEKLLGK